MPTADEALRHWDWPDPVELQPTTSGLINASWMVLHRGAPIAVLQRLNTRIFRAEVHHDIAGITAELHRQGLLAPSLMTTRSGALYVAEQDEVWRALTIVGSRTIDTLSDAAEARSAGRLVARFHGALSSFDWTFHHVRPGVHDTLRHMSVLRQALIDHADHALIHQVAPLARSILQAWEAQLPSAFPQLPRRIIHGDLKVSNLRFDGAEAVALIDLDTLAWGSLDVEIGDALRSWCGTAGEDSAEAVFDLALFEAAMRGYAEGAGAWGPTAAEWRSFVPATLRITTELAARFAADALRESYFGWDRTRFATAGDHNLLRAQGQWSLAQAISASRPEAERLLREAMRG